MGAVETGNAVDFDCRRAGAADARAHLAETGGEIRDLRFAGRVANQRGPTRGRRRHDRDVRSADRDLGKLDLRSRETLRRLGDGVACIDLDLGAELLKRHQQQVDRPGADRAAARQRDARRAHAGQQRGDHPEARAHLRHHFIGCGRVDDGAGAQMRRLARAGLLADTLAIDRIVDALIAKDVGELSDVSETRQIFQGQRLIGEKRRDHQRQRGILRPGNRDRAVQCRAAANLYAIHPRSLCVQTHPSKRSPPATPRQSRGAPGCAVGSPAG